MQIKIYFYIQWPWDNNATGIVVEYQLIVAAIAPSYVSRRRKGDVHLWNTLIHNVQFKICPVKLALDPDRIITVRGYWSFLCHVDRMDSSQVSSQHFL